MRRKAEEMLLSAGRLSVVCGQAGGCPWSVVSCPLHVLGQLQAENERLKIGRHETTDN
jgi:hypothetical protein